MKKLLLSAIFMCFFTINNSQIFAQEKENNAIANSNNVDTSPITVNQKIGSWQIHCAYPNNNDQKKNSQGCIAQQSLMITNKDNTQTPVVSLLLEKVRDNQNPTKSNLFRFTIVTPHGFSLQQPITFEIDQKNQMDLPWITCTTEGCIASQIVNNSLQKSMETNKLAHLVIHRVNNTTVTINFNIEDIHNIFTAMNALINKKTP